MTVYYTLKPSHIDALHRLYQQTWWSRGRTRQQTAELVAHSQITIAMTDEAERLLAFVRVLTDYTAKALIFDLIVQEEVRGSGLGRELLSLVLSHEALQGVKDIELYCVPEMVGYYRALGFGDMAAQLSLMRWEAGGR